MKCNEITAEEFNKRFPIGIRVRYWPIRLYDGKLLGNPLETKTTSEAWNLCGTPCVRVEGKIGGVSLDHLEVREKPEVDVSEAK